MNTLTTQEFEALSKTEQTTFLKNGGSINDNPEITNEETVQPVTGKEMVEVKGKELFYITKKANLLAYGSRTKASLRSADEGGNAGQHYFQCFYKGIGFAVNANDPFIKDLDARNLGEVTLELDKAVNGYSLLGYVPKDALVAMTKDDLELDILKAKAQFAKQAFRVENFQFNASDINSMITLG